MIWNPTASSAEQTVSDPTRLSHRDQHFVVGDIGKPATVAIPASQGPHIFEWGIRRGALAGSISPIEVHATGKQGGGIRTKAKNPAKMNTIMSYGTKMQAALERHKEFIAFDPNLGPHGAPYLVKSDFPMNIIAGCILRQWDTERIAERFQLEIDEIEATKSYIKDLTS